jgi:hypothetical protein
MGLGENIFFEQFLLDLKIEETYILGLHHIIKNSALFFKQKPNDICTNVFGIHAGLLWGANTDAQYILDPYAIALYYSSYLTKINKFVTQEMKIILNKCKHEQTETYEHIEKLGNAFLNAQQMSIQQVVHITLSIPLYRSTRSFQFINTCQQQDKAFVLLPQKKIQGLFPNSTKIHCKSLVDKYINQNEKLNDFCLT